MNFARLDREFVARLSVDEIGHRAAEVLQRTANAQRRPIVVVAALRILGLGEVLVRAAVVEAHRHRIVIAHPDCGGDQQVAARINRARDVIFTYLAENGR